VRNVVFIAVIMSVALCFPFTAFTDDKPIKATTPLSADEVAIYRAVLQKYGSAESGTLNVSIKTFPFVPESPTSGLKDSDCVKGIQLGNLSVVSHSFHELPTDVLTGKGMTLVDPKKHAKIARANDPSNTIPKGKSVDNAVKDAFASGLFSMSEIAFDEDTIMALSGTPFGAAPCAAMVRQSCLRRSTVSGKMQTVLAPVGCRRE
jgi:hypothetical protein